MEEENFYYCPECGEILRYFFDADPDESGYQCDTCGWVGSENEVNNN